MGDPGSTEYGRKFPQVFPVFAFRALHSTHMASREVFAFWLLSSSMNFTAQQLAVWPKIRKASFVAQLYPNFLQIPLCLVLCPSSSTLELWPVSLVHNGPLLVRSTCVGILD